MTESKLGHTVLSLTSQPEFYLSGNQPFFLSSKENRYCIFWPMMVLSLLSVGCLFSWLILFVLVKGGETRSSDYIVTAQNELCRPGWPQILPPKTSKLSATI